MAKTFKTAINKLANVKLNKNNLFNMKEGRNRRKIFFNDNQIEILFEKMEFLTVFNCINIYYRLQFGLWLYSEI